MNADRATARPEGRENRYRGEQTSGVSLRLASREVWSVLCGCAMRRSACNGFVIGPMNGGGSEASVARRFREPEARGAQDTPAWGSIIPLGAPRARRRATPGANAFTSRRC